MTSMRKCAAAFFLVIAGCSAEAPNTDRAQAPPTTELAAPSTTATETENSLPWLESVISDEPTNQGWELAPGEWATNAFLAPLSLDIPRGLELADITESLITLVPSEQGSIDRIVLARMAAVQNADGSRTPVPASPEEITELLEADSNATILDSGVVVGSSGIDVAWWDFVVDAPDPYPCSLGAACITIGLATGGAAIEARNEEPLRLYSVEGANRLGVYAIAMGEHRESLLAAAEQLATSTEPIDATAPDLDVVMLGSLSLRTRSMEAGRYRMLVSDSVLDLELADDLDGIGLVRADGQSAIFDGPTGFFAILELDTGVIDPEIDQSTFADLQLLADSDLYLSNPPRSIQAVSDWIDALFVLDAEGEDTIGGIEVPWLEFSIDPDNSFSCPEFYGSPSAERCAAMVAGWFHSDAEATNRHFVFAEIGVLVVVGANDGGPIDETLAEFRPLLDGMTLSPSGD